MVASLNTKVNSVISRFEQACINRDGSTLAIAEECAAEITDIKTTLLTTYHSSLLQEKITILGLLSRIESLASSPDYQFIDTEITKLQAIPDLTLPQRAALAVMSPTATDTELHAYLTALRTQLHHSPSPDKMALETAAAIALTLGIPA